MKKFRFQFEAIEKVRTRQQEAALRVLADAQRAYQAAVAYKVSLKEQLEETLIRREALGKTPISVIAFRMETDFITGTKQRIIQSDQAILRASKQVEKALRAYLVARRATKMMESIREKAYAEWKKERARYEQKQLEEQYVMRNRLANPHNLSEETQTHVA